MEVSFTSSVMRHCKWRMVFDLAAHFIPMNKASSLVVGSKSLQEIFFIFHKGRAKDGLLNSQSLGTALFVLVHVERYL